MKCSNRFTSGVNGIVHANITSYRLGVIFISRSKSYFILILLLPYLQTTSAFSALWSSSQTGSPPTKMCPSWGPEPPTSFTSGTCSIKSKQFKMKSLIFLFNMKINLECSNQNLQWPRFCNPYNCLFHKNDLWRTHCRCHSRPVCKSTGC